MSGISWRLGMAYSEQKACIWVFLKSKMYSMYSSLYIELHGRERGSGHRWSDYRTLEGSNAFDE